MFFIARYTYYYSGVGHIFSTTVRETRPQFALRQENQQHFDAEIYILLLGIRSHLDKQIN